MFFGDSWGCSSPALPILEDQILRVATRLGLTKVIVSGHIKISASGGWFCPVCGDKKLPGVQLPYGTTGMHTGGSHDICSCCETEYGLDDWSPGLSCLDAEWARVRLDWLDRSGWNAEALAQLEQNLGLTEAELRARQG